jgi:photosystem II stability/assembly factor-like uncharacterized protein
MKCGEAEWLQPVPRTPKFYFTILFHGSDPEDFQTSTHHPRVFSETIPFMRSLLILLAAATTLAQPKPQVQLSHTTESLRGVSAVSAQVAWASGTHGTYLRTIDAGRTWIPAQLPGAESLDFRGVVAFSADEAFLMSSGPGDQSRIYHTTDAGRHWQLQFTNSNPKGFFDSIAFWDPTHGVILGDPIPDESGKPKFELLLTTDGHTWTPIPPSQLPPAAEGESAFAASNSCLAILSNSALILSEDRRSAKRNACRSRRTPCISPSSPASQGFLTTTAFATSPQTGTSSSSAPPPQDSNLWFATGGRVARVFHSPDLGRTWQVFDTPITHGPDSAGIFSIAFRDATHGVIAGGDYKHPNQDGPNLAFTNDAGKTWTVSAIHPQAYFSAAAYAHTNENLSAKDKDKNLDDNQAHVRLFIAAPKFIFDFRPPQDPTRISPSKKSSIQFNAVSPYPTGGALFVGPNGSIATVP